eukprot:Unigene7640_Nuclearia_a/m.23479 Unigene7640_Nuclearia_a/g.23479  ORF Unigene7640_Nuclearia_a/g.23479 Unigene7640_Nuclearia_a/m.23479 type:complete len:100 (-) Unigene7640_Nuclearia_a:3-302(-)
MHYLFGLFKPYAERPENLFKSAKEACILLTLPRKSRKTAGRRDVITVDSAIEILFDSNWSETDIETDLLKPLGITRLSVEEARFVLSLHTNCHRQHQLQ